MPLWEALGHPTKEKALLDLKKACKAKNWQQYAEGRRLGQTQQQLQQQQLQQQQLQQQGLGPGLGQELVVGAEATASGPAAGAAAAGAAPAPAAAVVAAAVDEATAPHQVSIVWEGRQAMHRA
jgi:hypothetical protein